jgi:hypothetical protein
MKVVEKSVDCTALDIADVGLFNLLCPTAEAIVLSMLFSKATIEELEKSRFWLLASGLNVDDHGAGECSRGNKLANMHVDLGSFGLADDVESQLLVDVVILKGRVLSRLGGGLLSRL